MKKLVGFLLLLSLFPAGFTLSGQTIRREHWLNIPGTGVSALTSSPDYPANPSGTDFPDIFEAPVGFADNYGTRFRGYVHPPTTGNYVFWISSDDGGELYLSDDEFPATRRLIANVATWTGSREWDKEPNQQSEPIFLEAGKKYYVEALHKEGGGGDNVAVGWQLPDQTLERPIPGSRLSPFVVSTNPPAILIQPVSLSVAEGERAEFAVSASGGEPMSFQWRREGEPIPLQGHPRLVIDPVLVEDDGALFDCHISNPYGAVTTVMVQLTVTPEQVPPTVTTLTPAAGSVVRFFDLLDVFFSEPVTGVDASDLLVNGQPANSVSGVGAGPYRFSFHSPSPGPVQVSWAAGNQIIDGSQAQNPFAGGSWEVTLNPAATIPDIVLNEFVASNLNGLQDEDGQVGDWIELYNATDAEQSLAGWSLTDDPDLPDQWPFPDVVIPAHGYLVVFASGKDRRVAGSELHTNFQLSRVGEYIGLFNNELPRAVVDGVAPAYPEQRGNHSFGRDTVGVWRYYAVPTPGGANGDSTIEGLTGPVEFSARRGFYDQPFKLYLSAEPGAEIRYTTDASEPTATTGQLYTGPIDITGTTTLRAAAFVANKVPSVTVTQSYLMNMTDAIMSLPVLSLVTDTNNLFGETGIMEINPRNTVNRGIAWERPVSVEWIRSEDNGGFAMDAGLRVQGGAYIRERYDYNVGGREGKYSFRLYFRGDYGQTRLVYPLFPDVPFDEFEKVSLRAGMNDFSNPFIVDELVRRLFGDTGNVSSHGTLANLFLNGEYKGYYNPTERIDQDFLQSWHGGGNDWDLIAQGNEIREGDAIKWNEMRNFIIPNDMSDPAHYAAAGTMLDIDNFIDYLLVNIYAGVGDWPHNNWRAARERVPGARFQFIVWDAEWAFGNNGRTVAVNNITGELSGSSDIARMFQSLMQSPEFRMRFADRVHLHMFNEGPLTDENVSARYWELRNGMAGVLPGMNEYIHTTFIPGRRAVVLDQLFPFELYASDSAPVFSQHGGRIPDGFALSMSAPGGTIYYSLDGKDPRLPADANSQQWDLLAADAPKTALVPGAANGGVLLGDGWKGGAEPFDDSGWANSTGGIGYDTATTYDAHIDLDTEAEMFNVNASAYVRIPFDTTGIDLGEINRLNLNVQFDDGFVAYINGVRVASANAPSTLAWNSAATAGHSDAAAVSFTAFNISEHVNALVPGPNMLAFHALNVATNSSDFLINATITGRKIVPGKVSPLALTYADPIPINQPTTVLARTLENGEWSALSSATFTPNQIGIPVRITELMYNPPGGDAYEFMELHNVGFGEVDLAGFSFQGVNYLFPAGSRIGGGETIVLASDVNPAQFSGRYPSVQVFDHFGGSLDNGGERIALLDADGNVVTSVTYNDGGGWPESADGGGPSLTLNEFLSDPDEPSAWRASLEPVGNPGVVGGPAPLPVVRLNELMADNTNAVPHEGTFPDWVEIHNSGTLSVDLSDWSLTDDGDQRKFVFPANTTIPGGGYLVVWCDALTTSGLHAGFGLGINGESVLLYDNQTNLVDVVSYGVQISDYSVGRLVGFADPWRLNQPTPGAANQMAVVGDAGSLVINEWLANAAPGSDDWLELHNTDLLNPVSLQGIYLGNGTTVHALRGRSFLAPGGYLQIRADENAGADHVDFKLPALGGTIQLYDSLGALVQEVEYESQMEAVSEGRYPDGSASVRRFNGSASPGAGNYILDWAGPYINEFMARNEGSVTMANGRVADWIELFNPNGTPFDMTGMSLSFGGATPGEWMFPPGTTIGPNGYLVIWCDSDLPVSTTVGPEMNSGESLSGSGETIHLFNSLDQLVQTVTFGPQIADMAVGRESIFWRMKVSATPGAANGANAQIGPVSALLINEWQSNPDEGDDWMELHNTSPYPVVLGGIYLTDDPSIAGRTKSRIGPNSFIAGGGWLRLYADDNGEGGNHLSFSLAAGGEYINMFWSNLSPLDSVSFGPQDRGVSEGRFPDGNSTILTFATTPSPGESNYLPLDNVVVNEVLAHTDAPLEDSVEFYNPSGTPVDIGGWFLSDDSDDLKKFQIPAGTTIPANGYHVIHESAIDGGAGSITPFTFNSARGDAVYLSETDGVGTLTGFRAQVTFGPSFNAMSFGRYQTSVGVHFVPQSELTLGEANAPPRVGPVVISEIMSDPVELAGLANADAEYVELQNISAATVALFDPANPANTWRLAGGIELEFPPGLTMAPDTRLLVVGFDPVAQPLTLAAFRSRYEVDDTVTIVGPFFGRLAAARDTVRIAQPDSPQTSGPDIGLVPYVETERVAYSSTAPWPNAGIGSGASLQRVDTSSYGDDPANWTTAVPTAGYLNVSPLDSDGDGIPDFWERTHGLDPGLTADGVLDADGDGVRNVDEYRAGTNPRDAFDYLHIHTVSRNSVLTQLGFRARAGVSYEVQYRDALGEGTWQTLIQLAPSYQSGDLTINDGAAGGSRFYRVATPMGP